MIYVSIRSKKFLPFSTNGTVASVSTVSKKNKRSMKKVLLFAILSLSFSCSTDQVDTSEETDSSTLTNAPDWAKEVIWYQIFPERFRNGDPSNDPTAEDIIGSYPGFIPGDWAATPWTQDWYQPDPYFASLDGRTDDNGNPITNFGQKAQLRRYGGDLQGVMDQLDYLEDLGVTAIYFNPLNDAPSLHKYDARYWRHIDRNFGPTPEEDVRIMAAESPDDPSTWQMTGADRMFVNLIDQLHQRGMRVILDYSWNHTGDQCWAFLDVQEKGEESPFADWYWIEEYDDPTTPENEFDWKGWANVKGLPEIKETQKHEGNAVKAFEGDIYSQAAKQHMFNITQRWLDPNGDGDPSDGVDGFRLDVAGELPLGFWRDYRKFVRGINPETYLLGEIWWEEFPDKLLDPEPFLRGDVFDAVMNYRWYRAARSFFAQAPEKIPVSEFVDSLESFASNIRMQNSYAMMNVSASHDVPRLSTSLFNKSKYKYQASPNNENYKIYKPDEEAYESLRLLLAQQFTYVGAPQIWAGDEMGMWGADDPDTRKPLIWPDYEFEPETTHPLGIDRPTDEVKFDEDLFNYYKKLIRIRKENPVLATGNLEYLLVDDEKEILAYSRFDDEKEVIVLFNTGEEAQEVEVPKKFEGAYGEVVLTGRFDSGRLEGRAAMLLISK
jgi:cyclomaltodextrinase